MKESVWLHQGQIVPEQSGGLLWWSDSIGEQWQGGLELGDFQGPFQAKPFYEGQPEFLFTLHQVPHNPYLYFQSFISKWATPQSFIKAYQFLYSLSPAVFT